MARFCTTCGAALEDGDVFCTNCGSAVEADQGSNGVESLGGSGAASVQPGQPEQAGQAGQVPEQAPGATMTLPVSDASVAAPAPVPMGQTTPPPVTNVTPTPYVGATPPPYSTPTQPMQSAPVYAGQAPAAASNNRKTWIIVGIAAVVVIIIAAVVIAFTVMGGGSSQKYRVTFETSGGTPVASSEVTDGTSINEPAAPTRTDYRFDGWYLDSTYTSKVTFPYTVTEDLVLYAKWTEDSVSPASSSASAVASATAATPAASAGSANAGGSSKPETVTISVVGAGGDTRTGTIRRMGSTERIFPDSNTRVLSQGEINTLSDAEKCIAWNEIIAASNGYVFKNSGLRNYFNSCSWYHPDPNAGAGGSLSSAAQANVNALQASVDSWWMSLAAN